MKDGLKYAAGLALAAVLLWIVLRDVDPAQLWASVKRASVLGLLVSAVLNLSHNVFRVWRWKALLEPVRRDLHFRPMFVAVILGYMTSWTIPGRLGELVRPTLLSARERVPLGPCLGSVVADRLLDGVAIVVLFVAGIWLSPLTGEGAEYLGVIRSGSIFFIGFLTVFIGSLVVATSARAPLGRWVERRGKLLRWMGRTFLSIADGVRALREPRLLVRILVYSLLAWLVIALATWIGVRSVGADIPFGGMLVVLPILAFGVAVPTPGGAGSYHAAMAFGLMLYHVNEVVGVSAGILMHVVITVPVILLGIVFIWTEKISWKDVIAAARRLRDLGADASGPLQESAVMEEAS
jgi:uncharacterized protein (TIRG00374 family)